MAITEEQAAIDYTPVYNKIEVAVSSTNVAQTNFKFVFDVYIEGVSGYKRFKILPEPDYSLGVLDVARFLESYVYNTMAQYDSVVPFSLGANANGTASIIKWYIKYGEEYGSTPTVYPDLTTSNNKYSWNGSLDFNDWIDFDYNDYICNITNGASGQFLTDMKTNYVGINDAGWHHILSDTPTDVDYLVVKTYDSTGTLIQTATKAISVAQNLTASRMYKVATSPDTLNNMTGAFVTGAQPIITSSVASYTVQLTNSASAVASEILYFTIDEACRYDRQRVHFVNRFGSFDSFNFDLRSTKKRTHTKKSYKSNKYPVTASGTSYSHSDWSNIDHYNEITETLKLTSKPLTTEQHDWLKQLIESNEVYLEFTDADSAKNFKAVTIVNTEWVRKVESEDKIVLLEIELAMSHNSYRQRR